MTWINDTALALQLLGGRAKLKDIVDKVEEIRANKNAYVGSYVGLTVGLILNKHRDGYGQNIFTKIDRGIYGLRGTNYQLDYFFESDEIEDFAKDIKQESSILDEFERLIKLDTTTESDVGDIIKDNPPILGLHYISASSEDKIGLNGRTDFLIEKTDGFFDIIELKGPNDNIFTKDPKGHYAVWTAITKDAISQMISYLYKYDIYYLSQKEETRKDVIYPKGIIVIGRRDEEKKKALRIHNHFLSHIEIITYDDLLDQIKTSIKNLDRITYRR